MSDDQPTQQPVQSEKTSLDEALPVETTASETTTSYDLQALREAKTQELKEQFETIFAVGPLLAWAAGGFGTTLVVFLVAWAVLFIPPQATVIAFLALIYMALQGVFLGILAATLLVVSRLLQQLTTVVAVVIQTLRQSLKSARTLRSDREARAELIAGLIHGALVPAAQTAITAKTGRAHVVIGFVANRLLKRTARKLTRAIKSADKKFLKDLPSDLESNVSENADTPHALIATVDTSLARTDTHLDRLQQKVERVARRTRRATLIPATIFFLLASAFLSIPWLLARIALL